MHPSYQSVPAEFSHLLSTYIVFSGRASFSWAVDCPGLVLFLTGPAHDDNRAQRSAGIYWPLARQPYLYFVLEHPQAAFLPNQTHSLILFSS